MTRQQQKSIYFASAYSALRLLRHARALLLALCALVFLTGAARAQSGADGFDPDVNGVVNAVAVLSNGQVVIGGSFTTVNGQPRSNLARLYPGGALDSSFTAGTNNTVYALLAQPDDKVVVGGLFTTLGGQVRNRIGRLNADGGLDAGFNPGANEGVYALARQVDGKLLAGGKFTTLGGTTADRLARINPDGTRDASFGAHVGNGTVFAIAVLPNGKVVVGGSFTEAQGINNHPYLVRYNISGALESTALPFPDGAVYALAVRPDGKFYAGGNFTLLNGQTRNRLAQINGDGSVDGGFAPSLDLEANAITIQPNGKILVGGNFTQVNGLARQRLARFNFNGSLDSLTLNINGEVNALAMGPDGKAVMGGNFTIIDGVTRNHVAKLDNDGVDRDLAMAANDTVFTLAGQADGKILVGGKFTMLGGITHNHIGRLHANGTRDDSFTTSADGDVYAIAVQPDGKILVGGEFGIIGGTVRLGLARLNPNGTIDAAFGPVANGIVRAIVVQPDGKIIVAGSFTSLVGQTRNRIGRLNADGTLDTSFNPNANEAVYAVALQPDGKIVVGGNFSTLGGQTRNFIARLNSSGSLDSGFNPGAGSLVSALALQKDGKILVGGLFSQLSGQNRDHIGRLFEGGNIDLNFNPGANGLIFSIAVQADGYILVAGSFTELANNIRNNIGRLLNFSGSLDFSFDPGANAGVNALLVQADGKIVAGGNFSTLGGVTHTRLGRLTNNANMQQELSVNSAGTTITWERSGPGPEVSRVTFELSTDGVNYTALAAPARIGSSWQLTGQSLPSGQSFFIRARGFYQSGIYGGSGALVESVYQGHLIPCTFIVAPSDQPGLSASGGSGSVALDAANQLCLWTAQSNVPWITMATFSGIGSGSVGFLLAANPGAQRTGTMTIAGQTVTVTQNAAPCPTITITPATLPNATVGTAYNQTATATGGTAPYTFTISAGSLPSGVSLASGGALTGTPNAFGIYNFTIKATDANGCLGTRAYSVTINPNGGGGVNPGLQFYPLPKPIRLLDTRPGQVGCDAPGTAITGGTSRTQTAAGRTCSGITIPANAKALTGNITTVQSGGGYLTLYPSDAQQPLVANSNYSSNEVLNNVFTTGLGAGDGAFKIFVTSNTHLVVDVTGYYAPPAGDGLYFHPLPKPIRLLETRAGLTGCFMLGTPLAGGTNTIQTGHLTCDGVTIPSAARALVGNATTVSPQSAGYLTLYPADAAQPLVASSNFNTGQVMNGPFTVGLSAAGLFNIFTTSTTELVVDVLGYYSQEANDLNGTGLLFNPLPKPIRLLETRTAFTGCTAPGQPIFGGTTVTQQARITCDGVTIANTALALVGNATVVNANGGYLTFWPSNAAQPTVATSNFTAGQVFNRHFTVGLGADGAFKIFSPLTTDLVIDVSGFFAP